MCVEASMPIPRLSVVRDSPAIGESDDVALVEALRRRTPGSDRAAWIRFRPIVEGTLRRSMGPEGEVSDLAQEVFLRFFQGVHRLRDASAVRGFLIGISLRVVGAELRKRWFRRFLRLTPNGESPEQEVRVDLESREVLRRYYAVLERIGGQGRSLFVARQIEELPMADVAAMHGLSISTTQRRLRRVVRRVAAMVDADPVLAAYLDHIAPRAQGELP
jgi:RNA polymerase sigma-70 factor, ECF subfamily